MNTSPDFDSLERRITQEERNIAEKSQKARLWARRLSVFSASVLASCLAVWGFYNLSDNIAKRPQKSGTVQYFSTGPQIPKKKPFKEQETEIPDKPANSSQSKPKYASEISTHTKEKPVKQQQSPVERPPVIVYEKPSKSIHEKTKKKYYKDDSRDTRVTSFRSKYSQKKAEPVSTKNQHFYYFPVRGDYLISIAQDVYKDWTLWTRIQQKNRIEGTVIEVQQPLELESGLITDFSHVYKGVLPARYIQAESRDSLVSISRRFFGTSKYVKEIYWLNRRLNPRFSSIIYNKEYVFLPEVK